MIGVSGTSPTPAPASSAGAPPVSVTTSARAATVRCSNTSRTVSSRPARRARLTSWIDMMLSPPRSKKLSSIPASSRPSTSAKSAHSVFSRSVRGPRRPVPSRSAP
ncbi:hypothetical protein SGLAM104S_01433 [Streptomyces glaucescens]